MYIMAYESQQSCDSSKGFNAYTEFKEFDRKQIQHYQKMFKHYDTNKDGFIDAEELGHLMEKLKYGQTGEGLAAMIGEVDEDGDSRISLREFLLVFLKAKNEELQHEGWKKVYKQIHVDTS